MCLSVCNTVSGGGVTGVGYSITGVTATAASAASAAVCANDFLLIPAAKDTASANVADRFCGGSLNPNPAQTSSVTVCSKYQEYLPYTTVSSRPTDPSPMFFFQLQSSHSKSPIKPTTSNRQQPLVR